jgi:hypothetical protein
VSPFAHATTALAAGVRLLLQDIVLGFGLGGIVGFIVRSRQGSGWSEERRNLMVGRWGLVGVGFVLFLRALAEIG